MFTLHNPTKTADHRAYVVSSHPCPKCKEVLSIEIAPNKLYLYKQGGYAQDVLEGFEPDVRERFMTGFCPTCWAAMFGNDDDEEVETP